MKIVIYIILLMLVNSCITSYAQLKTSILKDTTIKVFGACIQCKQRIEKAVKGRGVKKAVWDIDSKQLSLEYDPSLVSLDKIENRIVGAGHDMESKKARDVVYKELPSCCHYREMESMISESKHEGGELKGEKELVLKGYSAIEKEVIPTNNAGPLIKGIVLEADKRGAFKPLEGASISWLGTNRGTTTDSTGIFVLPHEAGASRLVVSYTGYRSDTLTVIDLKEVKIVLAANKQLGEVIVTAKQRSTYLAALNPIRTQIMTEKELFKAACCNLSESFETNPSVDVSYNDAVTGSKQIQLLGLSGSYTQLTVENLPGPRGLATPLGLNSIAGPWVESIQLTKGIGSVANGYESIAGQINIELKKPESSEQLYANFYINDFGKTDLNVNMAHKIGSRWSTGLLLHDDLLTNKNLDMNKDGFRDLPTGNEFSMINRWKYDDGKGFLSQFGVKVLNDRRTGGETAFNSSNDKNTTNHYGLGINTDRYEAFAKIGYVFPGKKYKSIGWQLSATSHQQASYFGLTNYDARQGSFYSNLIYQSIIGNTNHKFRTGLSFLHDQYNEDFKHINYNRTEIVPGAFLEYTYTHTDKFNMVAGIRADHNNLFGYFLTPRLHIRYEPIKGTTIRASVGRGQRTANIFAENTSVFVSSRQVNILNAVAGKAYGLDPEVAWNKGVSIDQKFKFLGRDGSLSLDYFRNDFNNQVVVDLENAREVRFYNLMGKSYSNSIQAEVNIEPVKKLELRIAYRYYDVKTTYNGQLLERPFVANNRAFMNIAYAWNGWKFDYTASYNGTKRIPGTELNPDQYKRNDHSPAFLIMNAQISKTIGKRQPMDLYIGSENMGGYYQKDAIIAANQPFNPYFDASMVWGPITGRMFYAGWRFKLK